MERGDVVVDATCGNGWDTLFLLQALAAAGGGTVISCDIQALAIEKAKILLNRNLENVMNIDHDSSDEWICSPTDEMLQQYPTSRPVTVRWVLQSHLDVLQNMPAASVKVVVFNLGYLPGGDKNIVTIPAVTMATIAASRIALQEGGCISATCYPGHAEGKLEEDSIFADARALPVEIWSCYLHQWINQRNKKTGKRAPSLVLYQRVAQDPPPASEP
mmetsp:Transcript_97834/g.143218  ORF Transcript_97834/g.143218 Transcript_97834/m.143218 type:complete len:217 (-) Transcript_97834:225-875(-)